MASGEGGRIDTKVKEKAVSDAESQCKVGGLGNAEGATGDVWRRVSPSPANPKTLKLAVMYIYRLYIFDGR